MPQLSCALYPPVEIRKRVKAASQLFVSRCAEDDGGPAGDGCADMRPETLRLGPAPVRPKELHSMKLCSVCLRRAPLAMVFALSLAATGNAQAIPNSASDESAVHFTAGQRLEWFVDNTIGTGSLAADGASAGIGTAFNTPGMRGSSAESFVRRYEMHLAATAAGNALEAASGAIWGEDPRYFRVPTESFGKRLRNVIRMTFVAYRSDGHLAPAYGRYIGITGSSFLATSWGENAYSLHEAVLSTLGGFLGRMGSNAFQEFWPSVKPHLLRHLSPVHP